MPTNTTGTITGDLAKAYGSRKSPFKGGVVDDLLIGGVMGVTAAVTIAILGGALYGIGWLLPIAPWAPAVIDMSLIQGPLENGLVWAIDALCVIITILLIGRAMNGKSV